MRGKEKKKKKPGDKENNLVNSKRGTARVNHMG